MNSKSKKSEKIIKLIQYLRNILFILSFILVCMVQHAKFLLLSGTTDTYRLVRILAGIGIFFAIVHTIVSKNPLNLKFSCVFIIYPLIYLSVLLLTNWDLPVYTRINSPNCVQTFVIQESTTLASTEFKIYSPIYGPLYQLEGELTSGPGSHFKNDITVNWGDNQVSFEIDSGNTASHRTTIIYP